MSRVLVWFSCGMTSAYAAKKAIDKYGKERCEFLYSDTSEDEHPDNMRFMKDIEAWLGIKVKFLKSKKYKNVDDVLARINYIVGPRYAPCTKILKTQTRLDYQKPGDIHVFGYSKEEKGRMIRFETNPENSDLEIDWVLEDISEDECHLAIKKAGIKPNQMYLDGFTNANCIGCVKAGNLAYWGKIKEMYPEVYDKRAKQERRVNATINKDQRKGKPRQLFLDEMTEEDYARGMPLKDYKFGCGALCSIEEQKELF